MSVAKKTAVLWRTGDKPVVLCLTLFLDVYGKICIMEISTEGEAAEPKFLHSKMCLKRTKLEKLFKKCFKGF